MPAAVAIRTDYSAVEALFVRRWSQSHARAARLDQESSVRWLCDKSAKASAHLVIGRAGEVLQLAPANNATWHAGQSSWRSRPNVNGFSIGIEIVNPGIMQRTPADVERRIGDQRSAFDCGTIGYLLARLLVRLAEGMAGLPTREDGQCSEL